MANYFFDAGNGSLNSYRVNGTQLSSWSGVGGPTCAGNSQITCPIVPSVAEMDSITYDSPEYNFPVASGYYDVYFFAYGNYTRTGWLDGVQKFNNFNPYTDAGNTLQAREKIVSGYQVTGNSVNVKVTGSLGGGDVISAFAFIAVSPPADSTPPSAPTLGAVTNSAAGCSIAITSPGADAESGIDHLVFERSTNNFSTYTTIDPVSTASPFLDTNAPQGVAVKYRAKSVNGAGLPSTSYSNSVDGQRWNAAPTFTTAANLGNVNINEATDFAIGTTGGDGTRAVTAPDGLSAGASYAGGVLTINRATTDAFSQKLRVTDANGQYTERTFTATLVDPNAVPDDDLLPNKAEFIGRFDLLGLADGTAVNSAPDTSGKGRNLAGAGWTFETNEINGKSVVRANGSQTPLTNNAVFTLRCGWVLAKFNGANFSNFEGLLTDLTTNQVLVGGGNATTKFYDSGFDLYEFRSNDRIYPASNAPAPMNVFRLIFFRFWKPIQMNGISVGQNRDIAGYKWNGDIALMGLYSRDFCEKDIRATSKKIADYFALTLADVYPYQGMKTDEVSGSRLANVYDPPEGERIAEVLDEVKQSFGLTFGSPRRQEEFKAFREYYKNHYPEVPFIYRDYNMIPPEDTEGYFDSGWTKTGYGQMISYSVRFKEK